MPQQLLIPRQWRALLGLAVVIVLIPMLMGNDYFLLLFNVMALNALVVLGLNLLIGCAGQVSLGHAAFYGLGAYLSAIASTTWGWSLPGAFLFSLASVGGVSYLLALPTLRLEGHYLVMATLGFNIIVSILFNQLEGITGGPSGFPGIPYLALGPVTLDNDRWFYYFIWAVFLLVFAASLNLADSRLGRALRAIHEKELTARVLGIPCHEYKVMTFVLSALYAALAGFCYAHYVTFISPKTFDIFYSVQVVTMVVVGGMGSLWGGLVGAALLTCLPELLHQFEDYHVLIYGLILTSVLVFCPAGVVPAMVSWTRTIKKGKAPADQPVEAERTAGETGGVRVLRHLKTLPQGADAGLRGRSYERGRDQKRRALTVQGVSLHFGGLEALHEVSMEAAPSEIVALIGPNGAGKTTLLNIVSGLLKPHAGNIHLDGASLLGLPPHRIAARGVGRTFQAVQIYQKFTVLENVLLGFHIRGRSGFMATFLHTGGERREEHTMRERALKLLEAFNLEGKASWPGSQLTLLEQKLLELARALALSPSVLLLDEPAAGLNPRESEILVDFLSHLRQHGMSIVLVEHDMNVVMRLADRIVVLQHGSRIAAGTPREIRENQAVIAAYLGTSTG